MQVFIWAAQDRKGPSKRIAYPPSLSTFSTFSIYVSLSNSRSEHELFGMPLKASIFELVDTVDFKERVPLSRPVLANIHRNDCVPEALPKNLRIKFPGRACFLLYVFIL